MGNHKYCLFSTFYVPSLVRAFMQLLISKSQQFWEVREGSSFLQMRKLRLEILRCPRSQSRKVRGNIQGFSNSKSYYAFKYKVTLPSWKEYMEWKRESKMELWEFLTLKMRFQRREPRREKKNRAMQNKGENFQKKCIVKNSTCQRSKVNVD